jgi:hypothetical protein
VSAAVEKDLVTDRVRTSPVRRCGNTSPTETLIQRTVRMDAGEEGSLSPSPTPFEAAMSDFSPGDQR